jgi:hypothetical protein
MQITHQSAFSTHLAHLNFNLNSTLVVDLLHEFELGAWKNLFTHLVHILHASDPVLVIELDWRYVTVLQNYSGSPDVQNVL